MKKRIVSLLLVLCMVLSVLPAQAVAAAFSDTGNSWAQKSIERLSTLGVIAGSNGSFRPDQPITRAEVATIYSNLMGYRAQAANTFSDLSSSAWYYKAMLTANAAMVFQGANGKINPDANITRQEFFVSFARVLGLADEAEAASFTDASDIASWALPQINALIKAKLLTGISNHDFTYKLEPLREITRAEVAALVDRAFPGIFKEGGTYSDAIKGNAVIAVSDVTLSNLKIDGNLIIAEGVGEGEAILDTLAVPARTVIRGGGANSVILKGASTFGEIVMNKNASENPVSLKLEGTVHVSSIVAQEHSAQANILVGENTSVDAVSVHNTGTILSGGGKVGLVTVSANNVQITLPNTKIEVAKGVTGTTVGGKLINGGTVTTTDENGNMKTQETGGSAGDSGSVVQPPVTISFDTKGEGAIAPIAVEWGSTLPALPTLNKENATFLGWYLGDALVDTQLSVRENITLTAKFEETVAETLQQADTVFTLSEQETTLSFKLSAEGKNAAQIKNAIVLENLNNTGDITLDVAESNGGFTVTAVDGFTPNGAYRLTLEAGVNFAGKEDVIRTCEFTINRTESAEIKFNHSLEFLEADTIEAPTENGKSVSSLNIAPFTIDQASGKTTQNTTTGTLKLKEGADALDIGQVVCIYSGQSPENSRSDANIYDNNTAYVKITAYDEMTKVYTYTAAEAEEVLPTPDVLPVPTDADTDGDITNNSITVAKHVFDYTDTKYAPLDATTRADVGDFIGFYTGTFNDPSARTNQEPTFGQITSVSETEDAYIVGYTPITQDEMGKILNYYQTQEISPEVMLENVNVPEVEAQIRQQAIDSGFAEKAANFLAGSIVASDDFDNTLEGFDGDSVQVTTSDGQQMSLSQLRAAGNGRVTIEDIIVIPRISTETKHFDRGTGLMCSVEVSFTVKLSDTFFIFVVAYFEEELRMEVSASGDIIWAWVWIIPYIDDYQFSASVDVFNYTNIKIKATLATTSDEVDISEVIEDILSMTDEEEQRGGISELYELYADMMDGPGDWVELFTKPLFQLNLNLAYGIIHVRIDAKFVVKVEVKVSIGMEFEYISGDRYNFWLRVFDRTSASDSVRLLDQKTNFNFFVMGTIGVRAGVNIEIRVGLFSVDLASIGFGLEAGVQARLSGFFFYEYRNVNNVTITNKCAGALYFELGVYMEVYFFAGAFGGKYQYQSMLFSQDWPILTAGSRYNAYDFYELEAPLEEINLKKQNTNFYLPADLFSMQQLDLSTGENTKKQYPQSSFDINFTNPAFTFDGSKIIVNPKPTDHTLDGDMIIRYKNASLSFTSLPITRTIRLHWDDLNDGGYSISFNSNGGSYVPFISALYNATITAPKVPTTVGYTFGGWFTDEALTTPYTFGKMGASNITLHAKWTANTDTPYTVEHWRESVTGGSYELFETQTATGTTNATITPAAKSYEGFTAPSSQSLVVTGDGKATVRYEYRRNSYTLTFESGYGNEGKDVVRSVRYGAKIEAPNAAREGYTFTSWNSEVAEQMPARDLTYTARWSINSYTVEFWLGGNRVDKQTLTRSFGSELTLYTPPLPGEFSTFSGWYTDSGFSTKFSGVTMPAKNLVLFGAVVDNAVTYTVKHYKQNLTGDGYLTPESESHTASKGASITPGVKSYDGFTAPATQTVTLADGGTTVVEYHYDRNRYDLVFETDDGGILASAPEALILPYEMEITLPTPTAQGYDFVHWYLKGDAEQAAYTAATMPGKNITLKPKFAPSSNTVYTVEHWFENLDDAEYTRNDAKTQSLTGATGAQTAAVALTGIAGFTAKPVTQQTIAADGSTVVKCEYSRNSSTITFLPDAGGLMGTPPSPISGKYGAAVTLPSGVTAQGYTFAHWHKSGQSDTAYTSATMPAENLTLYPKFTPNTNTAYTVGHYTYPDGVTEILNKSETRYGTTGEQTAEIAPLDELLSNGYTMRAVSAKTILADGSTVLQCIYDKPIEFSGTGQALYDLIPTLYDGATLKLTANVELPDEVLIRKRLTIDGGGHTVTSARGAPGGAIFVAVGAAGDVTIQNITLDGNPTGAVPNASKQEGLRVAEHARLTLGTGSVIKNFSLGVKVFRGSLLINGAVIKNNGAGIEAIAADIVMNSGSIEDSTTNSGVYLDATNFIMNGGSITNNTSVAHGGGVRVSLISAFIMNGGIISNNSASSGGGICAHFFDADPAVYATLILNGGTITGNTAQTEGGGIHLAARSLTQWGINEFAGTTITGNSAPTNPGIHNEGGTLNNPHNNEAS